MNDLILRAQRRVVDAAKRLFAVRTTIGSKIESWDDWLREKELPPGSLIEIIDTSCCADLRRGKVPVGTALRVVRAVDGWFDFVGRTLDDTEDFYVCPKSFRVLWKPPRPLPMPWSAPNQTRENARRA